MYKIMTKVREESETKPALWAIYKEENVDGDIEDVELESDLKVEEKIKELLTTKGIPVSNILTYNPSAITVTVDVSEIL